MPTNLSAVGESTLAGWLMDGAGAEELRERQAAVSELAPLLAFRQEVALQARRLSADGPDPEPRHTEHGVHEQDSSGEDPSPNVP